MTDPYNSDQPRGWTDPMSNPSHAQPGNEPQPLANHVGSGQPGLAGPPNYGPSMHAGQPGYESPTTPDQPNYGNQPGYENQPQVNGQPGYVAPPQGGQPGYAPQPGHGGQPAYAPQPPQGGQPGYAPQPGYGGQPAYAPQPGYGEQPGYGQRYGGSIPGQGSPTGYGPQAYAMPPAVKPGIIAIRPLQIGDILDGAFRALRFNPKVMFGLTAILVCLQIIIDFSLSWLLTNAISTNAYEYTSDAAFGELLSTASGTFTSALATGVIASILSGLLVIPVSRAVLGEKISLSEVWEQGRSKVLRLFGLAALIMVIEILLVAIMFIPLLIAFFAAGSGADADAAIGLALVGTFFAFFLAIAAMYYVSIKTLFATPALVLEDLGIGTALKRGWKLSKGRFWRTVGIYLLISIIINLITSVITFPAMAIATWSSFSTGGLDQTSIPILIATYASVFVGSLITTPFMSSAIALLYVDARIRDEGLDIELVKAASRLP